MAAVRPARDANLPASHPVAPLLLPVARLWLETGGSVTDFNDLVRRAFVLAAAERARMRSGRINISAVAARTGLSRAEVNRLQRSQAPGATTPPSSRVERVLAGWKRDSRFLTAGGRPRSLPVKGARDSFHELVRIYSGDIPPRPILNEMLRLGLARSSPSGRVAMTPPDRGARARVDSALSSLLLLQRLLAAVPARALELPDTPLRIIAIPVANNRRVRQVGREALDRLDVQLAGLQAALADAPTGMQRKSARGSPQVLLLSLAAWLPR